MLIPALLGILLCAMLAWIIIYSKGHIILKVVAIPPAILYCVGLYITLPTMLGWPSDAKLPEKFELYAIKVDPPVGGQDGQILIWCGSLKPNEHQMLSMFQPDPYSSRLYTTPYSKQGHDEANKARAMLRKGQRVMGERGSIKAKGQKTKGKGKRGKKGKGKSKGSHGGEEGNPNVPFHFYKFPPVNNPPKDR